MYVVCIIDTINCLHTHTHTPTYIYIYIYRNDVAREGAGSVAWLYVIICCHILCLRFCTQTQCGLLDYALVKSYNKRSSARCVTDRPTDRQTDVLYLQLCVIISKQLKKQTTSKNMCNIFPCLWPKRSVGLRSQTRRRSIARPTDRPSDLETLSMRL